MQGKIITAVIAGLVTVFIVEVFLRPRFPQIKSSVDAFIAPAIITVI